MIVLPGEADNLRFYIDQKAARNHATVQYHYDAAKVEQTVNTGKLKVIYAVKSRYAGADFQGVYGLLESNQRLGLEAAHSFKDVEVFTFVVR